MEERRERNFNVFISFYVYLDNYFDYEINSAIITNGTIV